jgi:uncharacterized protein with GYD domain
MMPTYIVLGKLTEQGAKNVRDLPQRVRENMTMAEQRGIKIHGWYLTLGQYDYVVVAEAPDDQAQAAQALAVASRGLATTETLRAFTLEEAEQIIQKLG